jgi:hypothetical protein
MRNVNRSGLYRFLGNSDTRYGGKRMVNMRRQALFVAMGTLFMLSLCFGEAAWTHGDRGGSERIGLPGGILQELIFPCQACKDAISAVRTCGDSCITTFQTAASACRTTEQSCRSACETQ